MTGLAWLYLALLLVNGLYLGLSWARGDMGWVALHAASIAVCVWGVAYERRRGQG